MYAGSRLRGLSRIFLALMLILSFIIAIVAGRDMRGNFSFMTFLLILLIGGIMSVIGFIAMDAFGALVESSEMQATTLDSIYSELKALNKDERTLATKDFKISSLADKEAVTTWTCSHCHKKNSINTSVCACGHYRPV
jgi:hypothetical protein